MALKSYRDYVCGSDVIHGFMNETAEQGVMLVYAGTYTGKGVPGDANNIVMKPNTTGMVPFGLLLTDVKSVDLSRFPFWEKNFRRSTTICNPVVAARKGIFVTNMLDTGLTVTAGDTLYFKPTGIFTNVAGGADAVGGSSRFEGPIGDDGYATIYIDL